MAALHGPSPISCLARSENSAQRFYSLSTQIRSKRKAYYDILEKTQKSATEITPLLQWFLGDVLSGANSDGAGDFIVQRHGKGRFWEQLDVQSLNTRQRRVLNRLLDGFEGKLTTTKWAKLTKSSQDTAARDIQELLKQGILARSPEGGRSTSYHLILR